MKILWLSPWMRPLARVHAESLIALGDEVLMVTTDQHPESDATRAYEVVLDARVKRPGSWRPHAAALRRAREFAPDVVVTELVRDPRWLLFGTLAPRVHLVHDDRPHDSSENRPSWERSVFDRWGRSACAAAVFSEYVARAVRDDKVAGASTPVHVVPLTSDLAESQVPAVAPSSARRDFVLLGRINAYKNIDVLLDAWERHVLGPRWRGDRLVIIGRGTIERSLPPHSVHRHEAFRYTDELPALSNAKASLVHYRRASQSGVQVLAMQLGVPTIVSDQGALPEFRLPGEPILGVDDVDGVAAQLDRLADPDIAAQVGRHARVHYENNFHATIAGRRFRELLESVCRR